VSFPSLIAYPRFLKSHEHYISIILIYYGLSLDVIINHDYRLHGTVYYQQCQYF
jgi:hypothetical protein